MFVSGTSWLLVSLTVLAALTVFCTTLPKASDAGDSAVGVKDPAVLSRAAIITGKPAATKTAQK
jgi:hypothetical protein